MSFILQEMALGHIYTNNFILQRDMAFSMKCKSCMFMKKVFMLMILLYMKKLYMIKILRDSLMQ